MASREPRRAIARRKRYIVSSSRLWFLRPSEITDWTLDEYKDFLKGNGYY